MLVANEPRSYREVLATALQSLRPHVALLASEPTDLDRNVVRFEPHLAICSRLTETVQTRCPAWIVFYPNGTRIVEVKVAGLQLTHTDLELNELLAIIDHIERLAQLQ
jgi:hypothetical protein